MKRFTLLSTLTACLFPLMLAGQTANDLNEGSKLTWDQTNAIWHFAWWGRTGRTYFIQQSQDLIGAWVYVPVIEPGSDEVKQWGFTSSGSKFFLRLKYTDIPTSDPWNADFDGDGVGNNAELLQGTDPLAWSDTDSNGLPDDWELYYFGYIGVSAGGDEDGDGLTNLQEWQQKSDPQDYYNGITPFITLVDGDQQQVMPDRFTLDPLKVQVCNAQNAPLVNAPVEFKITRGAGRLSTVRYGASAGTVLVRTDAQGYAEIYLKVHSDDTVPNVALATAKGYAVQGVSFTALTSYNLPPAAPLNMNAVQTGTQSTEVTWEDASSDEVNFVIERSGDMLNWTVVGTVDAGETSFTDNNVPEHGMFFYRVSSTYGYE